MTKTACALAASCLLPLSFAFGAQADFQLDPGEPGLRLDGLRGEGFKSEIFGDAHRLVLNQKEAAGSGSAIFDSEAARAPEGFSFARVSAIFLNGMKAKDFISVSGSGNGRDFTPWSFKQAEDSKSLPEGFGAASFCYSSEKKWRFVKVSISGLDSKDYWKVQLSKVQLSDNGRIGEEAARNSTSGEGVEAISKFPAEAFSATISSGGKIDQNKISIRFLSNGKELKDCRIYAASRKGGSMLEIAAFSGTTPFDKAIVSGLDKLPSGKLSKPLFHKSRAEFEALFGKAAPVYEIPRKTDGSAASVELTELSAKPLGDDESEASAIPFWQGLSLSDADFKNRTWKSYGHYAPLSTDVKAYEYRLSAKGSPRPGEKTVLIIPFSAFVNTVRVNGVEAAKFYEGFLPLRVDLTKYLAKGQADVEILVENYKAAMNSRGDFIMPVGAMFKYTNGITVPPRLETSSLCDVKDIFVRSDVKTGVLEASASLLNQSEAGQELKAVCSVESLDGQELFKAEAPLKAPALSESAIEFKFGTGGKLKLWDIGQPNLYMAVFKLYAGDKLIQTRSERFGYRTVEISGEDILLNGRKIRLNGPWAHVGEWSYKNSYEGKHLSPKGVFERLLSSGMNYGRLHCQPYAKEFYDAADEAGFLIIAETALAHRPKAELSVEHARNFVKLLRNHPSIVIWSGSNEFEHWIVPRPEATMEFLVRVQDEIHKIDPTRPVQHSGFGDALGKLDIYNIHYPSETEEFPRCLYWKLKPELMTNKLYLENYAKYNPVGKKPVVYGEHFIPGERRNMAFFAGERFYELLNSSDPKADGEMEKIQGENWRLRIRAAREQNIAGTSPNVLYLGLDSPFLDVFKQECVPSGAYLKLAAPLLQSGVSQQTPVILFNDGASAFDGKMTARLSSGLTELFKEERKVSAKANSLEEISFAIAFPPVKEDMLGTLEIKLEDAKGATLFNDAREMKILASSAGLPQLGFKAALWGSSASIEALLKDCGVSFERVDGPAKLQSSPCKALIVCGGVPPEELKAKAGDIASFAANGGRVLLLDADLASEALPLDARRKPDGRGSCIGFVRATRSPLFASAPWSFSDLDFKHWGKDLLICRSVLLKPDSGNFSCLVDGGDNLEQAYLLEAPSGKGLYVASCLDFDAKPLPESARRIFNAILKRLDSYEAQEMKPGVYLGTSQGYSCSNFLSLGWKPYEKGMDLSCSTLAIDKQSLSLFGLTSCAKLASEAKNAILLDFDAASAVEISKLLVGSAVAAKKPGAAKGASFLSSKHALFEGISSHDLNWGSNFAPSSAFAPGNGWTVSTAQGLDAVYEANGRKIIFLSLPFGKDVQQQDMRSRFISELCGNLGVAVQGRRLRNKSAEAGK